MPVTSRTGLLPSVSKSVRSLSQKQREKFLEVPNLVVPAPFTLRPFAGIYNPFPYGCSILCNHPTDFEAKAIVQRAKDAWASEGKSLIDLEENAALRYTGRDILSHLDSYRRCDGPHDELFQKFSSTDSRPLTPAPTLASAANKISPSLTTRRCLTPDPTSFIPTKEKTFLVLDLRRSHSQETICWQRDQGTDSRELPEPTQETEPRAVTGQSIQPSKRKKMTPRKKSVASSGTASSVKTQNSRDSDSKVQAQDSLTSSSPTRSCLMLDPERDSVKTRHTSAASSSSDETVVLKRRGKKRKGKKSGKGNGKEGDKEFKGIPDPNETQVSALGSGSTSNGSSRPSLSGEERITGSHATEEPTPGLPRGNVQPDEEPKSFLNQDILKQLQRQLDQEVVDSEMNAKRRKALEEALRHKPSSKPHQQGEEMKSLKKEFDTSIKNSEKWLTIPRVFTRRCARFELPMDSRLLTGMTPFHYVQNYAFPSTARLVLYNHVFNLCKEEPEDDEENERIILGKNVVDGLGKVMGRSLTEGEAEDFQKLIGWKDEARLDFRTFTGICAACERLLAPQFCSKMPGQKEDPRHEVERADFETLEGKLRRLTPDARLQRILRTLRDL